MKNPELDALLKQARQPEIPEESKELFPRRVVARLKCSKPRTVTSRHFFPRLAWAFGLAVVVVIAFGMGHWHGRREANNHAVNDSLANLKLIQETLTLFPHRLRAIVQDEHGLNLVLSDTEDVPASAPLYVRICDGQHCTSLVTFSGQEIQIGSQKVTVLADANGGIILTGNHFVWSNTERTDADKHLKIEAKNLGAAAM